MEDKGIARDAIESAKRWLSSSVANASAGNYDLAVYSLEMSAEIALKALLFFTGVDAPKTHSIGDMVMRAVKEDATLSKKLGKDIDEFVHTLNSLSTFRSISGYIFETRSTLEDMRVKYERFSKETAKIVEMCDSAIRPMKRR